VEGEGSAFGFSGGLTAQATMVARPLLSFSFFSEQFDSHGDSHAAAHAERRHAIFSSVCF
jgi:hypothetical protein